MKQTDKDSNPINPAIRLYGIVATIFGFIMLIISFVLSVILPNAFTPETSPISADMMVKIMIVGRIGLVLSVIVIVCGALLIVTETIRLKNDE